MRTSPLLVVVLMAVACSEPGPAGPPGERGPQGERGPEGPPGNAADVALLRAEIDALKAQVAMVKPSTLPHLYVKATGEDLGVSPAPGVVFSTSMKHYVERLKSSARVVYFADPNCTGAAMLDKNFRPPVGVLFPDAGGRLYVGDSDDPASLAYQSHVDRDGRCIDDGAPVSGNMFSIRPTGDAIELYSPIELELR